MWLRGKNRICEWQVGRMMCTGGEVTKKGESDGKNWLVYDGKLILVLDRLEGDDGGGRKEEEEKYKGMQMTSKHQQHIY